MLTVVDSDPWREDFENAPKNEFERERNNDFQSINFSLVDGGEILVGEKWKQRRELRLLSKDPQTKKS